MLEEKQSLSMTSSADALRENLQDQQRKLFHKSKRRYWLYLLFYLGNAVQIIWHLQWFISGERLDICVFLVVQTICALGIGLGGFLTKNRRFCNIATCLFVVIFVSGRFVLDVLGALGLAGELIYIVLLFNIIDLPYAIAAGYLRLAFITVVLFYGNLHSYIAAYDVYTKFWFFWGSVTITIACHWFEYKMERIAGYRDSSLQIALKYCDELEVLKNEAENARDEARRADMSKSEFLAKMSHDVRTPLSGIVGMLHIAQKQVDRGENPTESLEKIKHATKQLEGLLTDVLEMSRLESGAERLIVESFDINEVRKDAFTTNSLLADSANVHYDSECHMKHHFVYGSPRHIRSIYMNIISNAIKYTRTNGDVMVSLEEREIDDSTSNYILTVKDNGIGMSKEFLAHIYEPFAREDNEMVSEKKGTGLGMAITKELVNLMGGSIQIESEVNVGTTCMVTIPLKLDLERRAEKGEDELPSLQGLHILVVDDTELNREITEVLLEERGAIVQTAENGRQALDRFAESPVGTFDVIITDIRMPVMDGLEEARRIRAMERADARTIPIVAFSANAFAEDLEKSAQAGINEHLSKPVDVEIFCRKISKYLK